MIRRLSFAALLGLSLPQVGLAQPAVPLSPGTTLFRLDLTGTPVGDAPATIKLLKGNVEVVRQGGVPMLKASAASEFLITLPQVLPADFTLEFELVPKLGSNPQDLSFEGTPTINQGSASAHVLWHATGYLSVIGGGGDNYEAPMPEDLKATLPGVLTHVVAELQGPTLKLYTNGRRHYTLDKQFARGRVLRVFLGAQDGGTEAVYLAGLRVSAGSGLGIIAANAGLSPATGSNSQGVTGTTGGSASTITKAGTGSPKQPISTPQAQPINPPSGPGVTAGPIPGGATNSPTATMNTQPPLIINLTAALGPVADPGCERSWCPDWLQANGACIASWCPDWRQADGACITSWCPDWRQGMVARKVTWSWTPPAGVATAMATFDRLVTDPSTGQLTTIRLTGTPIGLSSGASIAVVEGTALRVCLATQIDPADPTRLVAPTCLDTQVPGGAPATSSQSLASTGAMLPTVVSNVSVIQGSAGPVVNWTPVAVPAGYSVRRWKIDDQVCCNNSSAQNLTAPPWQDAPLSIAGTYVYEVTATMTGGTASGQAQFIHLKTAGQIALPPPPPPIMTTTNPGTTAGPITASGAAPAALTSLAVTAVTAPSTFPGYTKVTWNLAPGVYTVTFKRWKSDDPACCNYSSTAGAYTSAWWDPLGANGFPPGTYVYEVTANLASGPLQGRATYTIPATAVLAQPSGTGMVSPVPSTPVAAPTAAQTGVPTLSTPPPPPASIAPTPSAPPPVATYLTGTPAYVRVSWTMPNTAPRGMLYTVERYLESNPSCCRTSVSGLINKAWTDEGTQWPGTYVYRVTAVYPDGSTGFIDARWDRPDPVNPTNFRGAPSTGQVILQWDPVPNVDWYYLFGPGVPYNPFAVTPPIAQFVVRGLAPGTYTWVVGSYYSAPNAPAPVSTAASAFPTITVRVP